MRLKFHKHSVVKFVSRIIPYAKSYGTIFLAELMTLAKNEHSEVRSASGIILYAKHTVVSNNFCYWELMKLKCYKHSAVTFVS